ncbi:MAG: hypothetical protein R3F59_15680 [Myxococcota bacterium]
MLLGAEKPAGWGEMPSHPQAVWWHSSQAPVVSGSWDAGRSSRWQEMQVGSNAWSGSPAA